MSKIQAKLLVFTAFKVTSAIMFISKVFLYLCIALYVVGELLFKEYSQPVASPIAVCPDPWDEPSVTVAKTIVSSAVKSLEVPDVMKESIALEVDRSRYQVMTLPQLRQECSAIGIQWRNAHGKRHLSKAEMLAVLAAA